ncbi:hypothetical protein BABINDRAFT_161625 [Babjeviella inositovora NRRL Y-12698]|uniref:TFIIS N-terminal domain-containing protein n=1 Tax=Babjeviella inositovora NRRL Y-12698 TaxID=984486 RepID=A0A1E3QR54_9ASCO|nr:uncharacterized protein BABINDRAFT_161625 [Babjeviella inositovora NRRL Y-12698]ODQ79964.1 hypothetical protein BABINDRAFT_161625 [Babjeviella inositovora NRRL Y-12698]
MSDNELSPPNDDNSDFSDLSDVDEEQVLEDDVAQDLIRDLQSQKRSKPEGSQAPKKKVRRVRDDDRELSARGLRDEDEGDYAPVMGTQEGLRGIHAKMDAALRGNKTSRRKKDEHDLEQIQDELIDNLRRRMTDAARQDAEAVEKGEIAANKLSLLPEVRDVLLRSNYAVAILDNNLLDAVRLWLEPLPDRSLPAYEIQKTLLSAVQNLPISTDHLSASGLGKIMVFYQRSKKVEPALKKIAESLIGEWTRPIMKKSDNYRNKQIETTDFDVNKFLNNYALNKNKLTAAAESEQKTLYQESAERRKRAAAPTARSTAYKIAPKVDLSSLRSNKPNEIGSGALKGETYRNINSRLQSLGGRKKTTKKGGVSIEGRGVKLA